VKKMEEVEQMTTPYERYMTKVVTNTCAICKVSHTSTQARLNHAGWRHYSTESGDYAICPSCEKVRAEQAEERRSKEQREDYRGEAYGT